jgi:hypothetical protein
MNLTTEDKALHSCKPGFSIILYGVVPTVSIIDSESGVGTNRYPTS